MNRFGRPVEKEWLLVVPLYEFNHVVTVIIGQPLGLARFINAEILRTLSVQLPIGRIFPWRLPGDFHEACLQRSLPLATDIPFPNLSSDVSIIRHQSGQGGTILGNRETPRHPVFTETLPILAHDHTAPARTTWRIGDVRCGKADPFPGEAINVGCGDILASITPEISIPEIIDIDENNVWL